MRDSNIRTGRFDFQFYLKAWPVTHSSNPLIDRDKFLFLVFDTSCNLAVPSVNLCLYFALRLDSYEALDSGTSYTAVYGTMRGGLLFNPRLQHTMCRLV